MLLLLRQQTSPSEFIPVVLELDLTARPDAMTSTPSRHKQCSTRRQYRVNAEAAVILFY
ncbi:hypothetical protein DPMN_174872, partial [Dreissena polymorpha]